LKECAAEYSGEPADKRWDEPEVAQEREPSKSQSYEISNDGYSEQKWAGAPVTYQRPKQDAPRDRYGEQRGTVHRESGECEPRQRREE
jgi:hypothetical protein